MSRYGSNRLTMPAGSSVTHYDMSIAYNEHHNSKDPVISIGSSKPATPTFTWTISNNDLPTLDVDVEHKYSAFVWFLLQNTSAGNADLNFECWKNDDEEAFIDYSFGFGTLSASDIITIDVMNATKLGDVSVGDTIDIYIWSNVADAIKYQREGYIVVPTAIALVDTDLWAYNVEASFVELPTETVEMTASKLGNYSKLFHYYHSFVSFSITNGNDLVFGGLENRGSGNFSSGHGTNSYEDYSGSATFKTAFYPTSISWDIM